uniref:Tn3 family transposase n=1 Tax=Fulvivirga sp. TaxID=1931237 RepID=UPI00404A0E40
MKQNWTPDELLDHFTILEKEFELVSRHQGIGKLGFIILLKFFQIEARFPLSKLEIPQTIIGFIAKQLDLSTDLFSDYSLEGRTSMRHKKQIREHFGFQESSVFNYNKVKEWLLENSKWYDKEKVQYEAYSRYRELRIEPPPPDSLKTMVDSVVNSCEQNFFQRTTDKLNQDTKDRIDFLLKTLEVNELDDGVITLNTLRSDPGRIGLESVLKEIEKLKIIRDLEIPDSLFTSTPYTILNKYKLRVASELPGELRAHPQKIRYTLLSIFFWIRSQEITDNLIELLIQIIHKISSNAENKVVKEFVKDFKKVTGKYNILLKIAENSLEYPDGTVRDVIYPVVKEETLQDLVKELKKSDNAFKGRVFTMIKGSYSRHYRKMLPEILEILEFRSNNNQHKPVIEALQVVEEFMESNVKYLELNGTIPVDGIVRSGLKNSIIQKDNHGNSLIEKVEYEICVLQALRDKLRCKEIWVVGADKYRNPEEDLPQDFEEKRIEYYESLNQPENPEPFIAGLKEEMETALLKLNQSIPKNQDVRISNINKGRIILSPFDKQAEPKNIELLKGEILKMWPMVSLLNVLKETDLRINFTNIFQSTADREILDQEIKRRRLLLVLFGLGTNTGIKRIANATNDPVSFENLRYVKRKFINKDNLRNANISVVNAIHKARLNHIWGDGTTSCASDSKKFGAWDQNLMTEWHIRYRGRGVMIYWHVEKKSTCIYSQLKSCSSSEVAAMIEGVLKHCTNLEIDRNYVDTHGQSEVAFAFSHLLNFSLMPRFKSLSKKKLYLPNNDIKTDLDHLTPILTRSIDWNLIAEQYDQMIKYTTALKLGTAKAEAIMKRFTRNNLQHPTYKALQELGKVIKTIFLCEYLTSKPLRIEINEGLNVVENWNSANGFIFYGKSGEISTNNLEDQELSVLCLHLLQNSLVYVNTLMIQQILAMPEWESVMETEDLRALSPLIYKHINPYGRFELNMEDRIPLSIRQSA